MYILFDIGGTNMRLAASRDGKTFGEPKIVPTPAHFDEGIAVFKKLSLELADGEKILAAAGGIPGPLNKEKTEVLNAPNLPGWNKKPLKMQLEKATGAKVYIENDAAVAGLGEATYGAGKGKEIVAYLTISTGVGGARIVHGVIDANALGFEPGHHIIQMNSTGARDLESYISGKAVEKRFGKKPYEITDEAAWDEIAKFLAYGLNNITALWSPDIIVLGGSMMKKIGIPVERVRYHLKHIMKIFPELPQIEKAKLGDAAGLYGALAFLKQNLNQ